MAISVQMPALGESVTEGTVTRWLKQEGDTVEQDEPLLEVSTDKVDTEIPSPAAGVLKKIVAQEDDTVEVGGELAVIGDASEDGEASGGQAEAAEEQPAEQEQPAEEEKPAEEPEAQPEPAAEEQESQAEPESKPAAQSSGPAEATSVKMPELGESVTEGTVTRWLKKVGDSIEVDEPLVEVSTDKVDTEIPSPVAGTLLSITAEEDDTVAVGGELAKIGAAGETADSEPAPKPEPEPEPEKPEPKPESKPAPAAAEAPSGDAGPYVTPLVRKLAAENNIDLSTVKGTGVGGRIRKQDVLAAAEAKKAPAPEAPAKPAAAAPTPAPALAHLRGTTQKASRIRQITAKKTRESLQATAQLTQTHEVDMTKIVALRARAKA